MNVVRFPHRPLRLAFFGTPEIADTILGALLGTHEDSVALVISQPDRPRGRGRVLEAPPVKTRALAANIEVLQPERLKDGALARHLAREALDLAIVCAYGRILPNDVLGAFASGAWNVHTSLLPRHRGASPIQHTILSGDTEAGVTLMQMTAGLDEGPMLLQEKLTLFGSETSATLTRDLGDLGAKIVLDGLRKAKLEGLELVEQDSTAATYAPLLSKEDGVLDFREPAEQLERRVRAFNPWPTAQIPMETGPLRIHAARVVESAGAGPPGTMAPISGRIVVFCGAGALELVEVQPSGKRCMSGADFLRGAGRNLRPGAPLGSVIG